MVQKLGHELCKHVSVLQPVPVLRKRGRVPDRVVGRKSHEPAVQKIVVQLFHQLSFRSDAVKHLQQQCAQQLLRSDRATSFACVELPQADGAPAPVPRARGTKTACLDQKMRHACKPPPIRDKKTESANSRRGEEFFSGLLEHMTAELKSGILNLARM